MASFVKPDKMIAKRNAFSAFPSVWNGVELEDGIESEELKHQFSQVEGDLNLQEILEPIPISNKRALKKENNCGETWKWKSWKEVPLCVVRVKCFIKRKPWKKGRKREKRPKVI